MRPRIYIILLNDDQLLEGQKVLNTLTGTFRLPYLFQLNIEYTEKDIATHALQYILVGFDFNLIFTYY